MNRRNAILVSTAAVWGLGIWLWLTSCDCSRGVVIDYGLSRSWYPDFYVRTTGLDRLGHECSSTHEVPYEYIQNTNRGDSAFFP